MAKTVDGVFYAPFDFAFAVRRVLRVLEPALVIVMETEIWPNLFHEAKRFGAQLVVVNGRISDRALPRYKRLAWFFQSVLGLADRILVLRHGEIVGELRAEGATEEAIIELAMFGRRTESNGRMAGLAAPSPNQNVAMERRQT